MDEPAVVVRDLHKSYPGPSGPVRAVDGVDLTVARGTVVALLGPNGAGKTTTVEVLEGYRRRDAGTVEVLGRDPAQPTREWRARLGIVLQGTGDLADLTVGEAVRHVAGFYPAPRRPEEVLERVGLADQARTRCGALSGGRRRRLDVALGIVGDPELLFLDEPTTGFDPQARREFWTLVQDLAADGTTVLLTSHYLDEVEVLADEVAVVARGRVVATGSPSDLGGRHAQQALVSWLEGGAVRTEETASPTALVASLSARLAGPDGEVPGLQVRRPTLEDTYLRLLEEAS